MRKQIPERSSLRRSERIEWLWIWNKWKNAEKPKQRQALAKWT
jgi:hypothetical protein